MSSNKPVFLNSYINTERASLQSTTCSHEHGRQAFINDTQEALNGNDGWIKRHKRLLSKERQALKKLDGALLALMSLQHNARDSMRIKHVEEQIKLIKRHLASIALRKQGYSERLEPNDSSTREI